MKLSLVISVLSLLIAGCSFAPINTATTARTIGKDKNQITGSLPVLGVKYERGLTDALDLGLAYEHQMGPVAHAFGKYNFENKGESGISTAAIFGVGYSGGVGDSKSAYLGPIVSYRKDSFEIFAAYKFNYVRWDFEGISSDDKDDLISIPSSKSNFTYHGVDLGISLVKENFMATVGGKLFIFPDSTSSTPFVDLAFKF